MLILSRKVGDSIIIDDSITLTVKSIDKGVVKLGIDAPNDVSILRQELKDAISKSNKEAANSLEQKSLLDSLSQAFKQKK